MSVFVRVKTKEQLERTLQSGSADVLLVDGALLPTVNKTENKTGHNTDHKTENKIEHEIFLLDLRRSCPDVRFYLQLPDLLREKDAAYTEGLLKHAGEFDGIVLRTFDQIGLVQKLLPETILQLVGDAFLYTYNSQAAAAYRNLCPGMQFVISDELTDRELQNMLAAVSGSKDDFIYKIYGYQPLMITAQCLRKNYYGCRKGPELVSYHDEKGNRFYAKSECSSCYSIIYNGLPTSMLDKLNAGDGKFGIDGTVYAHVLLDFTIENAEETERVLQLFQDALQGKSADSLHFTRGHHYKGVE